MNTKSKAPLTRLTGILTLALMGSISCSHSPDHQGKLLVEQYKQRIVIGCPTSDPLTQYAQVSEIMAQFNRDGERARARAALVDSCPGLTDVQRRGYAQLIQAARGEAYAAAEQMDRAAAQRRADGIREAGRVMLEIQRTEDLNRIRRNQQNVID